MNAMCDFKIPVTKAISDFGGHLQANPRTILSSSFGDGKSYFLEAVKSDEDLSQKYEFLTIYPVNYQVTDNKDIFELIKRDILFQLLLHGMISNNVQFTKAEVYSWFINKKGVSLLADLLPYLSEIGLEDDDCVKVLQLMKGVKLFKSWKEKMEQFKTTQLINDDEQIEAFLNQLDKNFIYECDPITSIIKKTITDFKGRTSKKVVLIIEDMDRIDPAHLFRILNVLSAHMDYSYKCFVKPDPSFIGNKFDLDHIVLVIDYKNLEHIYHHFYGAETDFNGYICKFLSSVPFYYSLNKLKREYIIKQACELTTLPEKIIEYFIQDEVISNSTIRAFVQSFNIENQILKEPVAVIEGKFVKLDTSMLKLIAILRRLKKTDTEISNCILQLTKQDFTSFVIYVCPYIFISDKISDDTVYIFRDDNSYRQAAAEITLYTGNGTCLLMGHTYSQRNMIKDFSEYINGMLTYVAK